MRMLREMCGCCLALVLGGGVSGLAQSAAAVKDAPLPNPTDLM